MNTDALNVKTNEVSIRKVERSDCRFVWEINNQPIVRQNSISTVSIPWNDHEKWFETLFSRTDRFLFVASDESGLFGVVRFDIEKLNAVISIAISKAYFGRGLGARAIELGCREMFSKFRDLEMITAFVRPENPASAKSFLKAGFARTGKQEIDSVPLEVYILRRT